MSDGSKIEWTEATWNPVTGCTKVSQGCKHCYAERDWPRLAAPRAKPNIYTGREFTDVKCHPEKLDIPLRWTKPRRIFVNSMSDLFHEDVPFSFVDDVFTRIAFARQHIYQILTKRPERMLKYFETKRLINSVIGEWPWKHVWLGVSCEDQATADERIPLLLQTPAAVRWISAEPLLGPIEFDWYFKICKHWKSVDSLRQVPWHPPYPKHWYEKQSLVAAGWKLPIHWLVVGGESGPQARPMHPDWVRAIRDQCQAAGVPFFFKQWGEWGPHPHPPKHGKYTGAGIFLRPDGEWSEQGDWWCGTAYAMDKIGKKAAGRTLDGRMWDEYPA